MTVKTFSGAKVFALSKIKANLDSLINEVPSIQPIHLDLPEWGETAKVVYNIESLDGLVNNAAVIPVFADAVDVPKKALEQIFDVNLKAAMNILQVVGKKMKQAGKGGSIVKVSSMLGHRAYREYLPYCVSTAGLNMATKGFALELGKYKIRVNSISPGVVRTETVEQYGQDAIYQAASRMPIGRICEIEDVVDGVLFLLIDNSQMITGTNVVIDGGYLCYLPDRTSDIAQTL